MGDIERGIYGKSNKVQNWDKYSPLGMKTTPFKEEKVCAFCESKCDVIFPVTAKLCGECIQRITGRQDVMKGVRWVWDLTGYRCDKDGRVTYRPGQVNTRICNKCTVKVGRQTRLNRAQQLAGARSVFG